MAEKHVAKHGSTAPWTRVWREGVDVTDERRETWPLLARSEALRTSGLLGPDQDTSACERGRHHAKPSIVGLAVQGDLDVLDDRFETRAVHPANRFGFVDEHH